MDKELEAFGLIKRTCELYIQSRSYLVGSDIIENQINEALDTIKNRLESIDNANPSEALNVLKATEKYTGIDLTVVKNALLKVQEQELHNGGRLLNKEILSLKQCVEQCKDKPILYISETYGNKYVVPQKQFDDLTNENELLEKKARAFEIIKEKRIDIESFYSSFIERDFTYDFYSSFYGSYGRNKLTKEEFNLMIEVLR